MEISQEAIKEFTDLYHKRTGRVLGVEEAMERAYSLLGLYGAVLRPNAGEKSGVKKTQKDTNLEICKRQEKTRNWSFEKPRKTKEMRPIEVEK